MSYEKFIADKRLDEFNPNIAEALRRDVRFLQCFDFLDATEEGDEEVVFTKMALRGFVAVHIPTQGSPWVVNYYLDEATRLQHMLFNYGDTAKVIQTIGALLTMCLNPVPYAIQPEAQRNAVNEPPVLKVVDEPVPAYFSDPVDITQVSLGFDPEQAMQLKAQAFGAAVWVQFSVPGDIVAENTIIASKTLDQCQRFAEAMTGWEPISTCVHSVHQIIEQPTFKNWSDAKAKAIEMAEKYGHAVVIDETWYDKGPDGGGEPVDGTSFRVIAGNDAAECADLAGNAKIAFERSRDFPEHNTP